MSFQRGRYLANWISLAEALDLLYTASAYDKEGMNEYYKRLNEVQFYVNSMEIELEETKLELQQYRMAFSKCLDNKQDKTQHQRFEEIKKIIVK
jgi:hypothetical protein